MFVVVTIPKPGAQAGAWLAEWRALGPFDSYEEADAVRRELPNSLNWHHRTVLLQAATPADTAPVPPMETRS